MSGLANSDAAERAMSALTRGDFSGAERLATVALRYDPKNPRGLLVAGMAHQGMGNYDLARQYYEVIITGQVPGTIMTPGDGGVVMPRSIVDIARANMAVIDKITGRHVPRSATESGRPPGASAVGGPALPVMDASRAQYPGAPRPEVAAHGLAPIGGSGSGMSSAVGVTQADANVMGRFRILKRLLDEGLITIDEFSRRRSANLGALLPYSAPPASLGLERPVPGETAIVSRLRDLGATLETRAITPAQLAAERTVILDALLPDKPKQVGNPPLPPVDMLEAGKAVGRIERLKGDGLISPEEAQRERQAVDRAYDAVMSKYQVAPTPSAAPAPQAATEPKAAKAWGVAVATSKSEAEAKEDWRRIKAKFPEELGQYDAVFKKSVRKGKPTLWQVVAGPLPSKDASARLCKTLKLHRQSCDPATM